MADNCKLCRIALENVSVVRGGQTLLQDVSMHIHCGQLTVLIGQNGAGKTTLIRLICGLQAPTDGSFTLYGVKNTDARIGRSRRRMGAVVETPSIYLDMTAVENLRQQYLVLGLPSTDGIPELLHALADRGLKLAVLSNKPDADTKNVISHFFPDVPFSVVRGQVEGVPVKPDKAGALLVAEQLGIAPADFLYLGDTKVDMTCACSAGMNPVGVLWGFRTAQELLDNGAKVLIAHPMELLEKFNL